MIVREIQNISWDAEGGVEIAYYRPDTDLKAPGVALMHTLIVPRGFEYDDELDAVLSAVQLLVGDVLEDFDTLSALPIGDRSS